MANQRLPAFRGRAEEREVLDRLLEDVRGGRSHAPRDPRRSRRREDGAPPVCRSAGGRLSGGPGGRRRVGDGASLRRPAPALRSHAHAGRRAPRAAARRPSSCVRPHVGRRTGPVLGRTCHPRPPRPLRRGTAAARLRRRRPVARRRLGSGPRFRGAAAVGGVGRDRVRSARREATTKDSSSACPRCRSTGSRTRTRARTARDGRARATRRGHTRPDHRRDAAEIRSLCWSCREG